jgi:hypothetical protein
MSRRQSGRRRGRRRSHRKLCYLLGVVGSTGLALGVPLSLFYFHRQALHLAGFFMIYVFASLTALGVRGLLNYRDEQMRLYQ